MLLDGIRDAGAIDGIYLDLHGAMVTESCEDGEGELLERIRDLVGHAVPIAVSLDLHANVTRRMVDHASAITIFRTYPHLDMAETGGASLDRPGAPARWRISLQGVSPGAVSGPSSDAVHRGVARPGALRNR